MASAFDPETLERFRTLSPRQAYDRAKYLVYRDGSTTSDDFLEAYGQLVEHGILTWEQIEEFGD